jgi:hypothetical protein
MEWPIGHPPLGADRAHPGDAVGTRLNDNGDAIAPPSRLAGKICRHPLTQDEGAPKEARSGFEPLYGALQAPA